MKKRKMERVKILYIVFLVVLFLELLGALGAIIFGESSVIRDAGITNLFLVVITTIVILIPWIVESRYKIDIPDFLEVVLLSMVFIAVVLGFLNDYYVNVKGFDKFTHILSGVTLSIVAFQALYVLNKSSKISFSMPPFIMTVFAYTFSITLLVVWEFYEFVADTISFNLNSDTMRNMQRYQWINESLFFPQDYGLYDTMVDLLVGAVGALVVAIVGYLLIRKKSR